MNVAWDRLRRRSAATAVDVAATWPWLALLTGVGWAHRRRTGRAPSRRLVQPLVAIGLTAPVTVATAWLQTRHGTPGQRLLDLRVVDRTSGEPPGAAQSLARAALHVGVPWELAHAGVWAVQDPRTSRRGGVFLAMSYALVGADAVAVAVGDGRTLADRICSTRVEEIASPRRRQSGPRPGATPSAADPPRQP
jgi:hypothetical protein